MEYRLCISTRENSDGQRKSAFAFYNQHGFCVYKRVVDAALEGEMEFVRIAKMAVDYFIVNIRSRYYTEHFSELLSEDGGIVLSAYQGVVDAFLSYRENGGELEDTYHPLRDIFDIPSVRFELSSGGELFDRCDALIV